MSRETNSLPLSTPDGLRIAHLPAGAIERGHDVLAAVAEPRIDHRREPAERVDHGQDAQLATRRQLVVDEVHRPHIVRADRRRTVLPQLCLHPPLGCLVAQLKAQRPVKPVNLLGIHRPAFPAKEVIDTAVAVADMSLACNFALREIPINGGLFPPAPSKIAEVIELF